MKLQVSRVTLVIVPCNSMKLVSPRTECFLACVYILSTVLFQSFLCICAVLTPIKSTSTVSILQVAAIETQVSKVTSTPVSSSAPHQAELHHLTAQSQQGPDERQQQQQQQEQQQQQQQRQQQQASAAAVGVVAGNPGRKPEHLVRNSCTAKLLEVDTFQDNLWKYRHNYLGIKN